MKIKILVVGQTPPPFGGQAMMIERLVRASFTKIEIIHVRMAFSDNFKSVGTLDISKLTHLFSLIGTIIYNRFRYGVKILYYPPAGPNRIPFFRDLIILGFTRFLFSKTIYHFRAAGISEFIREQPGFIQRIAKVIYGKPTGAIQLSALNPPDAKYFGATLSFIIKNGLEDSARKYLPIHRPSTDRVNLLYAGVINETKGILVLLEAAKLLKDRQLDFNLVCIGDYASHQFQSVVESRVDYYNLNDCVSFLGVRVGDAKWQEFIRADIFCFPTYFESESFGNVVVEAMMFELPVIATRWRGIPDIITENETGFLISTHNPQALADRIEYLVSNPDLRLEMGRGGRKRFVTEFLIQRHLSAMEKAFVQVAQT